MANRAGFIKFLFRTGDCEHPDMANRVGCTAEELYGFTCPTTVGQGRYAAKDDCRAFFTCAVYTNYHPRLSMHFPNLKISCQFINGK
jgi:hypothetical protein